MSTLYGDDVVVGYAKTHSQYPAGSVLSLVTWTLREDSRRFRAKIPSEVKSVEFVTVGAPENGEPQRPTRLPRWQRSSPARFPRQQTERR